jgi:hypothetical protein
MIIGNRAIALELPRDDRKQRWSRAELEIQLAADRPESGQPAVEDALRLLNDEGVLGLAEERCGRPGPRGDWTSSG